VVKKRKGDSEKESETSEGGEYSEQEDSKDMETEDGKKVSIKGPKKQIVKKRATRAAA